MSPAADKFNVDSEYSSQLKNLRILSRKFLQIANAGVSRTEFSESILRLILPWVGCDRIRCITFGPVRRFFYELEASRENSLRTEISLINDQNRPIEWLYSPNKGLEKACLDIVEMRTSFSKPWITAYGSFLAEDLDKIPDTVVAPDESEDAAGFKISDNCRSMIIVPIDGTKNRLGLFQMESKSAGFFSTRRVGILERMVQIFGFAMDWRGLQVALRERVKELSCLYGIARLVVRADTSLDEVLQDAVNLLPPAWLYPEVAAARISFDKRIFMTPGADRMVQSMTANIAVGEIIRGKVEVGYTSEKPPVDEGPFLVEERNLIDTIANELAFIIEQKLYSEEKQRLQDQLRRADRLATIGKLAAGVAHEINEPLSNILGFAQLAGKDSGISDQTKKDLDKIIAATLHARDVIKDLLTFAREAEPVKVEFNLNDLVEDGLYFLEARFVKAGINLICDLSPDLPKIMADRSQMLQILTNLVVNSVQAMPEGGRLKITTSSSDDHILLSVEDSGIGMDKETLNKIFNPFFTTKDINEGTGLGLSVVHGIVTAHGGEIDVQSHKNRGTRFRIKFPLDITDCKATGESDKNGRYE